MRKRWMWAIVSSLFVLGNARVASAEDAIDARLVEELRAEAPDQVEAWEAAIVLARVDAAKALEGFVAVGEKTSRFSAAHRRACRLAAELDQRDRALALCEAAVARERSAWNLEALALVLAEHDKDTTARDPSKARALVREALARPDADVYARALACGVAAYDSVASADDCARKIPEEDKDAKRLALAAVLGAALREENDQYGVSSSTALCRLFPDDADILPARGHFALRTNDKQAMRTTATRLRELSPNDPRGHLLAAFASVMEGNLSQAREDADRAERAGLPAEQVASLRRAIEESESPLAKWGKRLGMLLGGWLAALGLLWGAGEILSRRVLREIATAGDRTVEPSAAELSLRRAYKRVIWLASAFFYVSLPLVGLSVVGLFGALVLFFLAIGLIPIKLLVIGGVLAFASIAAMLGGLTRVRTDLDPGEPLPLAAHPRLEAALRQVADEVGTPPVDRVFVTPGTELAVFERGTVGAALRQRSERCLVLGLGVLEGLDENAFRAILAHEHGHFAHGDTAGGELALAVRRSLLRTAVGLAEAGAATGFNPAWHFVKGYYSLFLRISHGASRLQEVQADRFAAACYGPEAFERGLTHVITRDVRFHANADALVAECAKKTTIFKNLYQQLPAQAPEETPLVAAVAESLDREPSPYDSHPSPKERFALVRRVLQKPRPEAAIVPDDALAWDLFDRREALELLMTEHIRIELGERGLRLPAEAKEPPAEPATEATPSAEAVAPKKKKRKKAAVTEE